MGVSAGVSEYGGAGVRECGRGRVLGSGWCVAGLGCDGAVGVVLEKTGGGWMKILTPLGTVKVQGRASVDKVDQVAAGKEKSAAEAKARETAEGQAGGSGSKPLTSYFAPGPAPASSDVAAAGPGSAKSGK